MKRCRNSQFQIQYHTLKWHSNFVNTLSCPIIFNSNTIELTVHTSFYCLELTLCYQTSTKICFHKKNSFCTNPIISFPDQLLGAVHETRLKPVLLFVIWILGQEWRGPKRKRRTCQLSFCQARVTLDRFAVSRLPKLI